MDRITRKELKQDKFAQEVGLTVEYFSEHRQQIIRYGTVAAVVLVVVLGFLAWRRYQHRMAEQALNAALEVHHAPIGPPPADFIKSYPTEQERQKAAVKALSDVAAKYSGSEEGAIARYYLGVMAADDGKPAEAEKVLRDVIDSASANYASLAKLALGEVYRSEGKIADGEKVLRSLMAKPTEFVSKEQATVALGKLLMQSNPAEARKLLEPLRTDRTAISKISLTLLSEMQQQQK